MKDIEQFLITARTKTYAGSTGKVAPLLDGSKQLEYAEGDWLYRDIYYTGKSTFNGIETVFHNNKPVFGMSYYGNWGDMTETEIDLVLRAALIAEPTTRLCKKIEWVKDVFIYICEPDTNTDANEIGGTEIISKKGVQVYKFYYAGGLLIH
ncbi:MAG: DUF5680 domain-containing protein [Candidatus Saccharibacteria bacterium]